MDWTAREETVREPLELRMAAVPKITLLIVGAEITPVTTRLDVRREFAFSHGESIEAIKWPCCTSTTGVVVLV
jgi:hypothetical protein